MSEFIHDDCCERCPNTMQCYATGECLLEPPVAPSRSAAPPPTVIVGVCREDNRFDVDEAYGAGTYDRLFPSAENDEEEI